VAFTAPLWRHPGKGGWTFATVPPALAPAWTRGWGRTPVVASVDGVTWATSVWRNRHAQVDLPVPRAVRGTKGDGDVVDVRLTYDRADD
jgi:hypothetical protein